MEKQLSFELKVLSSGKQPSSSLKKHLSSKKDKKPKQKNQERQFVKELLPKTKKDPTLGLGFLSLEGVKSETSFLNKAPSAVQTSDEQFLNKQSSEKQSPKREMFIDNLITVEELAVVFRLAPQTIRNWVALRKIPYVRIGRRSFFQKRSLQEWLNRKEEPQWQ